MDYEKLLKQTVDLHVHVGPEIIPRRYTVRELLTCETKKLKGIGIKNHFFPTIAMFEESCDLTIVYSVVLNHYIGGFNADIIRASAELSSQPIIVWFPTIHADNFLKTQKFEIAEEWIAKAKRETMQIPLARDIEGLTIFDKNGRLRRDVIQVLQTIKDYNAILATGHISWQESAYLVRYAVKKIGITKIIITHPIYQNINMPLHVQKELASFGAFIEHSYSMYAIDNIPIDSIIEQIKEVGAEHCIITSDVGQTFSSSPSQALESFAKILLAIGIPERDVWTMLVTNPNILIA